MIVHPCRCGLDVAYERHLDARSFAEHGSFCLTEKKESHSVKRWIALVLFLSMMLAAMPAVAQNDYYGNMEVINCNEWVSLRAEPRTSAKRLVKVPLGANVTECQQYGAGWIYAVYDGKQGYIQDKYLKQCEGVSVYSVMLVNEGADFYETMGEMTPEGTIPENSIVRDCAVYASGRACVKYGGRSVYVSAEHVTPYTELLHFPQRVTLHCNLYEAKEESSAPALGIAYVDDFPIKEYDYSEYESDEYMQADGDVPKAAFVLYSDSVVNHVHLFNVSMASWDSETGVVVYDAVLDNIQYQVDPEHPLFIGAVIWGDTPNLAVGYQDWTGAYHFAFVEISGEDGSLILREF